jgi:hypothetical protein
MVDPGVLLLKTIYLAANGKELLGFVLPCHFQKGPWGDGEK